MDTNQLSNAQFHQMMGVMATFWVVILCIVLITRVLAIWFFWRIFEKAGYSGAIALINIISLGTLISVLILAFGTWPNQQRLAPAGTPVSTG